MHIVLHFYYSVCFGMCVLSEILFSHQEVEKNHLKQYIVTPLNASTIEYFQLIKEFIYKRPLW